ncbi:hypothetical protein PF005_g7009 [Phytophthora fragariae]|uniref:HAT C-terminal dimerisation domain-containing protein n=1 Tax=Phytophthora fragariae TaxID=53985 RepID=A0A6A3U6N7_9STRA|nr:hypothetical protein PF003_g39344 [Phytophthora fragariae]KAE9145430.1 hypothetical protein PF006_g9709 [Phytophthora fragariae]KAE9221667.1 hypothetical protein PF005_g7009 [Phytophthora fragariae]KAE9238626.1 hypothetical protein PF004_g8262 [Phytophthora fragariae]KAE9239597.1 hypothetical protein PF002_g10191 [Phytophthora fragariae]
MISSTMYVLLRVAFARMNSYKFSSYCLGGARDTETNEKNFPRIQLMLPDLSGLVQRCIKRTLYQIAERLPKPSVPMGMALLLDARTKTAAKNFLRIPDTAEGVTDVILEESKALMRVEHRAFYRGLHAHDDQGENSADSASSSPSAECNSSSDTEADLLYGEEVSQPVEESTAEAIMNAKADALLDDWLSFRVEWAEVAKSQYPAKAEYELVLSKLSKRNVHVWNVEQLCGNIDVCRWFADIGEKMYPSIAKLARVWLGRGISTAFQERVFSTGSFVMSPLRTRTDNERAQRQLILRHNRDELRRMEENKQKLR